MFVISIQSQVVYGSVGNSAAVFPMQRAGVDVAPVPTTLLSNHPHYPTMRGKILDAELVADLLVGVEERGLIEKASVILSGYLGSVEIADVVARFVAKAKTQNPALQYVLDPVMGDDDLGVFVDEGLLNVFRDRLLPLSTGITPNQYELGLLTRRTIRDWEALTDACQTIIQSGCRSVVVTGCSFPDTPNGMVETVLVDDGMTDRIRTARLPIRPCGTGDLLTGLMTAGLAKGATLKEALNDAVAQTYRVLDETLLAETEEMRLVKLGL